LKLVVFTSAQLIAFCVAAAVTLCLGAQWPIEVFAVLLAALSCETVVLLFLLRGIRPDRFLAWALGDEAADEVSGDLEEVYLRETDLFGNTRARRRYRRALFLVIILRLWDSAMRLAFLKRRA
jgi:hypothetical protein